MPYFVQYYAVQKIGCHFTFNVLIFNVFQQQQKIIANLSYFLLTFFFLFIFV